MSVMFVIRRLFFLLIVIWSAATITFFIPRLSDRVPIREPRDEKCDRGSGPDHDEKEKQATDNEHHAHRTSSIINAVGEFVRTELAPTNDNSPTGIILSRI